MINSALCNESALLQSSRGLLQSSVAFLVADLSHRIKPSGSIAVSRLARAKAEV